MMMHTDDPALVQDRKDLEYVLSILHRIRVWDVCQDNGEIAPDSFLCLMIEVDRILAKHGREIPK